LMMGKKLKVVSPKWIKEKVQQLHQASFNNYNLHEN
jgi:hypothetical protein